MEHEKKMAILLASYEKICNEIIKVKTEKRPSKALDGPIKKRIYLCSKCGQPKKGHTCLLSN